MPQSSPPGFQSSDRYSDVDSSELVPRLPRLFPTLRQLFHTLRQLFHTPRQLSTSELFPTLPKQITSEVSTSELFPTLRKQITSEVFPTLPRQISTSEVLLYPTLPSQLSPVSSPRGSLVSHSSSSGTLDSLAYSEVEDDFLPMIEIFKMTYLGNEGHLKVMPYEQNGFIKICSEKGVQYVYRADAQNEKWRPVIEHKDEIDVMLSWPIYCYSEDIFMEYDLFCGDYKGRICLGWFPEGDEAIPMKLRLESKNFSRDIVITMGYFSNATVATLEVTLSGISAATKIFGVVAANNSKLDKPNCTSLLFVKKPHNAVTAVDKGGVIPLTKSCIAVPLHSVLYVDVSLSVDDCKRIASLHFNAQKEGESTKSTCDGIKVKVSWCAEEDKMCSMYDE